MNKKVYMILAINFLYLINISKDTDGKQSEQ